MIYFTYFKAFDVDDEDGSSSELIEFLPNDELLSSLRSRFPDLMKVTDSLGSIGWLFTSERTVLEVTETLQRVLSDESVAFLAPIDLQEDNSEWAPLELQALQERALIALQGLLDAEDAAAASEPVENR